jgi:hypothetical protein
MQAEAIKESNRRLAVEMVGFNDFDTPLLRKTMRAIEEARDWLEYQAFVSSTPDKDDDNALIKSLANRISDAYDRGKWGQITRI